MEITPARAFALTLCLSAVVLLSACTVVRHHKRGDATVSIATPLGGMVVRTGQDVGHTGMPVYPSRENDDTDGANVTLGTRWFGLHVVAAEYESRDAPGRVLDFLPRTDENVRRRDRVPRQYQLQGRPTCLSLSQPFSSHVQLLVGIEEQHRVVSVKPRGSGSGFALVSIQTAARE